jgi:hypothetical protein
MGLLLGNLRGQAAELIQRAIDLALRFVALAAIHPLSGAGQSPTGSVGDRRHHVQVA